MNSHPFLGNLVVASESRSRHALRSSVLTVIAHTSVLVGCDHSKGRAAIQEFCGRDGGMRITATAQANGYLEMESAADCLACLDQVGSRQFEYVDADFKGSNPSLLFEEQGYYRVSRGPHSDPRCSRYLKAVERNLIGGP